MLFNSVIFLVFFLIVYSVFHLQPEKYRKYTLLLSSMVFYGAWDYLNFESPFPRFLFHFFTVIAVNYIFIAGMQSTESAGKRKLFLVAALVLNILNLAFFKYFYFIIDAAGILAGHPEWVAQAKTEFKIILPIAISFYTFQTIAFLVDKYRGEIPEKTSFTDFALFIFFFPQQLAGPILRAKEFLPYLSKPLPVDSEMIRMGLIFIGTGLIKKAVIADSMAEFVNPVFANPSAASSPEILMASVGFLFQIWGDFAGYSDMAIGCGRLLGFVLPRNFIAPFLASRFSEMWLRWHITLSSFLRDYLYFPMGGSRVSSVRASVNVMLTMTLAGLWHGANWNFVLWGFVIGLSLVIETNILDRFYFWRESKTGTAVTVRWFLVFCFWTFIAVIFRVNQVSDLAVLAKGLFAVKPAMGKIRPDQFASLCLLTALLHYAELKIEILNRRIFHSKIFFAAAAAVLMFVLADLSNKQVQFIYFQF